MLGLIMSSFLPPPAAAAELAEELPPEAAEAAEEALPLLMHCQLRQHCRSGRALGCQLIGQMDIDHALTSG